MHTLLIGFSSIARRRVIPALVSCGIGTLDIASVSSAGAVQRPEGVVGTTYDSYERALEDSKASLVYISTINSLHARLAVLALRSGRHVVLDKPACLSLGDARRIAELAREKHRLVAEATVWSYHPQVERTRSVFQNEESRPCSLVAVFTIPPLPQANYRFSEAAGGGAMWDFGPYAVSCGRVFFGEPPLTVKASCTVPDGAEVDYAFSAILTYSGNRCVTAHMGMIGSYLNRLLVLGPGVSAVIDRVFSPPAGLACAIEADCRGGRRTETVGMFDTFAIFLQRVIAAIGAGRLDDFTQAMIDDAEALQRLRNSAKG